MRLRERQGISSVFYAKMTVPNEIIGCVIGKGGSKIAEIRCSSKTIKAFLVKTETEYLTNDLADTENSP